MKDLILTIRVCCLAFVLLLFVFEGSPAQQSGIDFGIESCSVEKIPGTDSVLVTADIVYVVADSSAEAVDVHYRILFDDDVAATGSVHIDDLPLNDCYSYFFPCSGRYCPPLDGVPGECRGGEAQPCYCFYWFATLWRVAEPYGTEVTIVLDDISAIPELDETNNECSTTYVPPEIPTLTEWGLIIFGVVLLGFITWVFLKRRKVAAVRV